MKRHETFKDIHSSQEMDIKYFGDPLTQQTSIWLLIDSSQITNPLSGLNISLSCLFIYGQISASVSAVPSWAQVDFGSISKTYLSYSI